MLLNHKAHEGGAGRIFNLPRTDDFSRRGKVPSHLRAKVVSTVAFQNKIKNLSCTPRRTLSRHGIAYFIESIH